MSVLRPGMKIVALFVLLFGIITVPGILIEYQNLGVLDDVTPYSVKTSSFEDENGGKEEMSDQNIWERIDMINRATTLVQSIEYTPLQINGELCRKMEEQLEILQELGAIPELDIAEPVDGTYTKRVYMDSKQPEMAVTMWLINVKYEDAFFSIHMDADCSAIYEVVLTVCSSIALSGRSDGSRKAFFEYLNGFSGNRSAAEREDSVFYACAKDQMCLSVT